MAAATMGEYTKDEFFRGFQRLNCDSVSAMKKKLPTLRKELSDDDKFKDTYEYAFGFSREKGQKSLTLDTAIGMWKLLFGIYEWTLCDSWCDFIETNHKKVSEYRVPHSLQNYPRADALLSPSPPPPTRLSPRTRGSSSSSSPSSSGTTCPTTTRTERGPT